MIDSLLTLIWRYVTLYPAIHTINSHRSLDPRRRIDPGPNFFWSTIAAAFPRLEIVK
jgi:N-acetyl-anhydromuramyl-L-alanine amidase AmpD